MSDRPETCTYNVKYNGDAQQRMLSFDGRCLTMAWNLSSPSVNE